MKKILCLLLCVAMLLPALFVPVAAEDMVEDTSMGEGELNVGKTLHEIVKEEARQSYVLARKAARRSSFHGWCGLMVSHQLKELGINKKRVSLNGNDQYDYYCDMEMTTGGYYINAYDAADYSLKEALLAVSRDGKRDVRNIMVGFQWTNTSAGRYYGHVLFINGIIDGTVYFVESFDFHFGDEGTVISCSIDTFVDFFDKWTSFEGLIHFGTGRYSDVCSGVPTDILVQARFDCQLRSEPALVGQKGCYEIRQVAAGERLQVTGVYTDERTAYYEVITPEGVGYVSPYAVSTIGVNSGSLQLEGGVLPAVCNPGEPLALEGKVVSDLLTVEKVEACVFNEEGSMVNQLAVPGNDLAALSEQLHVEYLTPGQYRLQIHVDAKLYEANGQQELALREHMLAWETPLQVGDAPAQTVETRDLRSGWIFEDGAWKLYMLGNPCTGWVSLYGVRYYLLEDGSPAIGWNMVGDELLYFSAQGALVTGWLRVGGLTYYRLGNGTAATGWLQLEDGSAYHFADDGVMTVSGELKKDGVTYVFAPDGRATPKSEIVIENEQA